MKRCFTKTVTRLRKLFIKYSIPLLFFLSSFWAYPQKCEDLDSLQKIECYLDVFELDPSSQNASLLAEAYLDAEQYGPCSKFLNQYLADSSEVCEPYFWQAVLMLRTGGWSPDMIEGLETSLLYCDDEMAKNVLLLLAETFYETEYYEECNTVYNDLIELAPNDPEVLYNAGSFKSDVGIFEEAVFLLKHYNTIDDSDPLVWAQLGYAFLGLEEADSAVKALTESIKLDSSDYEVWYNRGIAQATAGNFNQAIHDFSYSYQLKKDDATLYNLALTHQNKAEWPQAIRYYNDYIIRNREDAEAYLNRGWCKYENNDKYGACADWKILLELNRKDMYREVKSICKD